MGLVFWFRSCRGFGIQFRVSALTVKDAASGDCGLGCKIKIQRFACEAWEIGVHGWIQF